MTKHWIAVVSADHARRGKAGGFMQANHGMESPLRRIHPGDGVAFYSPTATFRGKDKLQAFTMIGRVQPGEIYTAVIDERIVHRRDVAWAEATDAPIAPLLGTLEFTAGQKNWGYKLRFGLFEISAHDFEVIAEAMGALVANDHH